MAHHFEDREPLYRVISDGQPLYVRAKSFKEAMEKFLAWDVEDNALDCINAIEQVEGDLIIEGKTRE